MQYDIILDEDLTEFEKMGKLSYFPLVQNPDENWTLATGQITKQMLESTMPEPLCLNSEDKTKEDSVIIVCGPDGLKKAMKELFAEMKWQNVFYFD